MGHFSYNSITGTNPRINSIIATDTKVETNILNKTVNVSSHHHMVKAIRPNININGIDRIIGSNKAIIISKIRKTGDKVGPTIIGFLEPDKNLEMIYISVHCFKMINNINSNIINDLS